MKIVLNESQLKSLLEKINSDKVICDECGWSWDLSEGGDDPYLCHNCGHNNDELIGKRVMVYYNLNKHTFSVRYKNKVVLHADYLKLQNVEFRVRKGGRESVLKTKEKNVHAFVIGDLIDYCQFPCENIPTEPNNKIVTYNPYKYDSFIYKDTEEPVYTAKEIDMINLKNKLFVINEVKSTILRESEEKSTKDSDTTMGFYNNKDKLFQVIYKYINTYYDFDDIHWINPYEYGEDGYENENEFLIQFYYGDWVDSEYSHFIFFYFFPEYYSDESSSMSIKEKSPILRINDDDFLNNLNTYFGDRWKPVFKKWFMDKFNLPIKTLTPYL